MIGYMVKFIPSVTIGFTTIPTFDIFVAKYFWYTNEWINDIYYWKDAVVYFQWYDRDMNGQ